MTGDTRSLKTARNELYDIIQQDLSFEEKAVKALEIGKQYLDADHGFLTRIDQATDHWETVVSTDTPGGRFPAGLKADLNSTYCRHTITGDDSVALSDVPNQGRGEDPAFKQSGIHCYHGTKLVIDGEPYGTVCFVAEDSRKLFSDGETMFAELVAKLLEQELEYHRYTKETTLKANSALVLSRILRHNLRNEMTIVRGRVNMLANQLDSSEERDSSNDDLFDSIDRVIALSDKARKLESVVSTREDKEPIALESLFDRATSSVTSEFPKATVSIDVPAEFTINATPSLELALTEVIENAAKHAGDTPRVEVTVESTDDVVTINVTDDGSGLPSQEQDVLAEGSETPLIHGSGLGLWMVYWIITSNDGTIEPTVTDEGTTITITLPRHDTDTGFDPQRIHELERGRDRFEAVFDESFDAMLIINDARRILDANEGAADLLQADSSDLLGRRIEEFTADSFDIDSTWRTLQVEGSYSGDGKIVQSNGTERGIEYTATVDIVPGQHLIIARDVTERNQREKELQNTKQRLELALSGTDTGVFEYHVETGALVWSEDLEKMVGLEPGSFPSTIEASMERTHEDDTSALEATLQEAIDTGEPYQTEFRLRHQEGHYIWVEVNGRPVEQDGEQMLIGLVQEITDRKERERELRNAKAQLENAIEAGAVGTWEWHVQEDRFVTGQEFARTFGVDPEEAQQGVGLENIVAGIHEEDRTRVQKQIQAALDACGDYEAEYRVWDANDQLRRVLARGHVECDGNGTPIRFPGVLVDLTD